MSPIEKTVEANGVTLVKHRGVIANDPYLVGTFETDDGGKEGFIIELGTRDTDEKYVARNPYGDRGTAPTCASACLRLWREWARKQQNSPHEQSVGRFLKESESEALFFLMQSLMTVK